MCVYITIELVLLLYHDCSMLSNNYYNYYAAQTIVELSPPQEQSVCQGQTITFSCRSNGFAIFMYSPPIVSETLRLTFLSTGNAEPCIVQSNAYVTSSLIDDADSSFTVGTLTLYIRPESTTGSQTMYCSASTDSIGLTEVQNSTTFTIVGKDSNTII